MPRSSSDEDYKTNHGQSKKNLFESEEFSIFKDSTALFSENQKKPQPSRIDSQRPYHSTSSTKSTLLLHKNNEINNPKIEFSSLSKKLNRPHETILEQFFPQCEIKYPESWKLRPSQKNFKSANSFIVYEDNVMTCILTKSRNNIEMLYDPNCVFGRNTKMTSPIIAFIGYYKENIKDSDEERYIVFLHPNQKYIRVDVESLSPNINSYKKQNFKEIMKEEGIIKNDTELNNPIPEEEEEDEEGEHNEDYDEEDHNIKNGPISAAGNSKTIQKTGPFWGLFG